MSERAEFELWFATTYCDADGQCQHRPVWFKSAMEAAWRACSAKLESTPPKVGSGELDAAGGAPYGVVISTAADGQETRVSVKEWIAEVGVSVRITLGIFLGNHRWYEAEIEPKDAKILANTILSKPSVAALASPVDHPVQTEAVGTVESVTGSLNDMTIIRWYGEQPPVGTKLYAGPPVDHPEVVGVKSLKGIRDCLEAIEYASGNCIKEHGQKTVNELAKVALSYLDDPSSPPAGAPDAISVLRNLVNRVEPILEEARGVIIGFAVDYMDTPSEHSTVQKIDAFRAAREASR